MAEGTRIPLDRLVAEFREQVSQIDAIRADLQSRTSNPEDPWASLDSWAGLDTYVLTRAFDGLLDARRSRGEWFREMAEWAAEQWGLQVKNRPKENYKYPGLDSAFKQMERHCLEEAARAEGQPCPHPRFDARSTPGSDGDWGILACRVCDAELWAWGTYDDVLGIRATGVYYWDPEYPDEGRVGPFETVHEAIEHASSAFKPARVSEDDERSASLSRLAQELDWLRSILAYFEEKAELVVDPNDDAYVTVSLMLPVVPGGGVREAVLDVLASEKARA